MVEGLRHASYVLKVKIPPELQSARIRADDEVELHASEAVPSCVVQRVQTHRACNAATRRIRTHHVTAIADVLAGASLIGTNVIRAGDLTVLLSYKRLSVLTKSVGDCISLCHIAVQRVGLPGTDRRANDTPDGRMICL